MNNAGDALSQLMVLGFSGEEAKLYLELLIKPSTHQELARATGINRTKVYRLAADLERKSLISQRIDDRGTFLVASDPTALEVALVAREEKLKSQRRVMRSLVPRLAELQSKDSRAFVLRTYEGESGLKQMAWHELRTKGELLSFGNGTIEQLTSDEAWTRRHRERQKEAGYRTRELVNYTHGAKELPELTTEDIMSEKLYSFRVLPSSFLTFDNQTIIYNETVAVYHWKYKRVGVEIISPTYAHMMRQMFEHFWETASQHKAT